MASLLVVDDEPRMLKILTLELSDQGHQVQTANDGREAMNLLEEQEVDAVVTDIRMPEVSGHDLLRHIKGTHPHLPVILMTAHGTIESAVAAMRDGATDYILKPVNFEELGLILKRSLNVRRLVLENEYLREEIAERRGYEDLIGKSPAMQEVFQMLDLVASSDSTVLIRGASGTGKELVAQAIHNRSGRAQKPFVPINCAAVPPDLLESELFGHVKGAFTSADRNRMGKFEVADGGTLFLDEIGDMGAPLQAKLLRAIQERVVEPVGAKEPRKVNVRIVAATNVDLEGKVKAGEFREDLYYRLNVVPILLPPLKDRRSDIPLLLHHFLRKKSHGTPPFSIPPETMKNLMEYDWPGNVRELENVVERAVVLRSPVILDNIQSDRKTARGVRELAASEFEGLSYKDAKQIVLKIFEKTYFSKILDDAEGNVSRAAESAGMHRKNFYQKLAELELDPHDFQEKHGENETATESLKED